MTRVRAENSQAWHDLSAAVVDSALDVGIITIVLDATQISDKDSAFINSTTPRIWEVDGVDYIQVTIGNLPQSKCIVVRAFYDSGAALQKAVKAVAAVAQKYGG